MTGGDAVFQAARLPRWALSADWPMVKGLPALADITVAAGRVASIEPHAAQPAANGTAAVGPTTSTAAGVTSRAKPMPVMRWAIAATTMTVARMSHGRSTQGGYCAKVNGRGYSPSFAFSAASTSP